MSSLPHTIEVEDVVARPVDHLWASSTGGTRGYKRFFIVSDPKSGTVSWAIETKDDGRLEFADVHEAVAAYNEA
jgi:hypothetical protein